MHKFIKIKIIIGFDHLLSDLDEKKDTKRIYYARKFNQKNI